MEENESQNQQSEGGAWNDLTPHQDAHAAELQEQAAVAPAPQKNPETTPTAELVADYEALLAEIKVRKTNHDDNLKSLDGMRLEAVTAYEAAIKGASVEAAKLLVVISKRLGMPLNGPQPTLQRSTLAFDSGTPIRTGNKGTPCKVCGKLFRAGMGMHMQMHVRRGETAAGQTAERRMHHAKGAPNTRWCDQCATAIHVKGWTAHQAAHGRHGAALPRKVSNSAAYTTSTYTQSMGDEKIKTLLIALRTHQPIGSKELGQRLGQPNISAYITGLKERGLAINHDAKWTLTAKGAALIS